MCTILWENNLGRTRLGSCCLASFLPMPPARLNHMVVKWCWLSAQLRLSTGMPTQVVSAWPAYGSWMFYLLSNLGWASHEWTIQETQKKAAWSTLIKRRKPFSVISSTFITKGCKLHERIEKRGHRFHSSMRSMSKILITFLKTATDFLNNISVSSFPKTNKKTIKRNQTVVSIYRIPLVLYPQLVCILCLCIFSFFESFE